MNDSTSAIRNASFLIYGSGLVYLVIYFVGTSTIIPGFHHLSGIVWALFEFWAGAIIRRAFPKLRWLIIIPNLLLALPGILLSIVPSQNLLILILPAISMFCLGFVTPLEKLETKYFNNSLAILLVLLLVIFCYVAVRVANNIWNLFPPEREDVKSLFSLLMSATRTLLMIATVYLATMFSFTKIGQTIGMGHHGWLKWIVAAIAIIFYLHYLFIFANHGNILMNDPSTWCDLSRVIIQPFNVYLCVVLFRRIIKRLSWKECAAELFSFS